DGAEIARERLQREIEIVQWDRAVIYDDLVDQPFLPYAAIVAADGRDETIALAADRFEPVGHRERYVALLQAAHIGNEIHPHHFRREGAVGRHHFELRAALGDKLGGL